LVVVVSKADFIKQLYASNRNTILVSVLAFSITAIATFQIITKRKRSEQRSADYSRELEQEISQHMAELARIKEQLQQEIREREQAEIKLRDSQEQLRLITDSVPAGIAYVDAERRYRFVNKTYELRFNLSREAILGKYVWEIIGQETYNNVKSTIDQVLQGDQKSIEFDITYHTGHTSYISCTLSPAFDASNTVIGYYLVFFDITERKRLEDSLKVANDQLEQLVTFDGLTHIANRRKFDDYLMHEWQRLERSQAVLSLILFDVDFFKHYNDCYGHQAGDACLIQIAQAAQDVVNRPADLVARYGGEEFAVILPNTDQQGALVVAENIQHAIRALAIPHERSQVGAIVSISLGIASTVPTPDTLPDILITLADRALYTAKQQGRDRYSVSI